MILSRRNFVLGLAGVAVMRHRPKHRPTPIPGLIGPAFVVGVSLAGGAHLVGGA